MLRREAYRRPATGEVAGPGGDDTQHYPVGAGAVCETPVLRPIRYILPFAVQPPWPALGTWFADAFLGNADLPLPEPTAGTALLAP